MKSSHCEQFEMKEERALLAGTEDSIRQWIAVLNFRVSIASALWLNRHTEEVLDIISKPSLRSAEIHMKGGH
jgi:hypothetical protein